MYVILKHWQKYLHLSACADVEGLILFIGRRFFLLWKSFSNRPFFFWLQKLSSWNHWEDVARDSFRMVCDSFSCSEGGVSELDNKCWDVDDFAEQEHPDAVLPVPSNKVGPWIEALKDGSGWFEDPLLHSVLFGKYVALDNSSKNLALACPTSALNNGGRERICLIFFISSCCFVSWLCSSSCNHCCNSSSLMFRACCISWPRPWRRFNCWFFRTSWRCTLRESQCCE